MNTTVAQAHRARASAARTRRAACREGCHAAVLRGAGRKHHLAAIQAVRHSRRLCYDRFGTVLAMWPDGSSQSEGIGQLLIRLFQVSMTLAACRALSADALDVQLEDAMYQLDGIIGDLRPFAFGGVDEPDMVGSTAIAPHELLDRLSAIADSLHMLSQQYASDGSLAMQLGDAAHGVQRAWIVVRDGLGQQGLPT